MGNRLLYAHECHAPMAVLEFPAGAHTDFGAWRSRGDGRRQRRRAAGGSAHRAGWGPMLTTWLTERLGIRYPVISASMTGVAHGQLARAVSRAGGLGMLGIGSQVPIEALAQEARIASDGGELPFGVGLTAWALPDRPDLVD